MKRRRAAVILLMWSSASVLVSPVTAQERAPQPPSATPAPSAINVDRLPLDLHRIERQLKQAEETEQRDGLRLQYFVPVYGKAPKIELFTPGESLRYGPTPGGGPTHSDMLQIMTPKEFQSPPMDFNALIQWLTGKLNK